MSEEDKFDGILMSIVQQSAGIDGFFDAVFGFLRRRTDFFTDMKQAEQQIVKHSKVHYEKFMAKKKQEEEETQRRKEKEETKKKTQPTATEEKKPEPKVEEKPKEEQKQEAAPEKKEESSGNKTEGSEKKDDEPKRGTLPGNGGTTDKYTWTQTLEESHIYIPVPQNIKGKDLVIKLTNSKVLVQIKGATPIIDGQFPEKIHEDDSMWTLEDSKNGKVVHLAIQKWKTDWKWWDCAIKGDAKIDTQKIEPEPSNLSDLDGELRQTVEKMMFDQRQKQMGLPTSEEMDKQSKLEKFMKAHPEMDFSKAKFC